MWKCPVILMSCSQLNAAYTSRYSLKQVRKVWTIILIVLVIFILLHTHAGPILKRPLHQTHLSSTPWELGVWVWLACSQVQMQRNSDAVISQNKGQGSWIVRFFFTSLCHLRFFFSHKGRGIVLGYLTKNVNCISLKKLGERWTYLWSKL